MKTPNVHSKKLKRTTNQSHANRYFAVRALLLTGALIASFPSQAGPVNPQPEKGERGVIHHPKSCWIDGSGARSDDDVDMMLIVVGLNHQTYSKAAVNREGVQALASTIRRAWRHPERLVIVSSSFTNVCAPTSGTCLAEELQRQYNTNKFYLREEIAFTEHNPFEGHAPTLGVISGQRWEPKFSSRRMAPTNPGSGIAEVHLYDAKTGITVPVYAMHTADGDGAIPEIRSVARIASEAMNAKKTGQQYATPIIAGDFNLADTTYIPAPKASCLFRDNFSWLNDNVRCSSVADLPDHAFRTQDGNKMHALAGRIDARDPMDAFPCAAATLERVSMTYLVDEQGKLRARPPAWREGITVDNIAHNVLAIGLRIEKRIAAGECNDTKSWEQPKAGRWLACKPAPGVYRLSLGSDIYSFTETTSCHVKNEDQLTALFGNPSLGLLGQFEFQSIQFKGLCVWPDGFFKEKGKATVYRLYKGKKWCRVRDEAQMRDLGGFSQMREVAAQSALGQGRTWTGPCVGGSSSQAWPDGFLKEIDNARVYRLYGGTRWCAVRDEAQMNRFGGFDLVREVPAKSDLGRGRTWTGICVG